MSRSWWQFATPDQLDACEATRLKRALGEANPDSTTRVVASNSRRRCFEVADELARFDMFPGDYDLLVTVGDAMAEYRYEAPGLRSIGVAGERESELLHTHLRRVRAWHDSAAPQQSSSVPRRVTARAPRSAYLPSGWISVSLESTGRLPLVVDIPHAGRLYARPSPVREDPYVDLIGQPLIASSCGAVTAEIARSIVDMNRPIPGGHDIEAFTAYHAYHDSISYLIAQAIQQFGVAIHISLHSYAVDYPAPTGVFRSPMEAHVSDRLSASAHPGFSMRFARAIARRGLITGWNQSFFGGETQRRHGAPKLGIDSVQVEVRRDLYLQEDGAIDPTKCEQLGKFLIQALEEAIV